MTEALKALERAFAHADDQVVAFCWKMEGRNDLSAEAKDHAKAARESVYELRKAVNAVRAALSAGAAGDEEIERIWKVHRHNQQMGPGDRYEQHDMIGTLLRKVDELTRAAKET